MEANRIKSAVLGGLIFAATVGGATALHAECVTMSTFDTDDEGWMIVEAGQHENPLPIVDTYPPDWNPAGYICGTDTSTQHFWFSAPSKFLGDKLCAYDGSLSFDLNVDGTSSEFATGVALVGGGLTLYRNNVPGPGLDWTPYEIALSASSDWVLNAQTGSAATAGEWETVLSSLEGLYILGDWKGGTGETTCLDNVVLAPEPGAVLLLACAGVLIARRR